MLLPKQELLFCSPNLRLRLEGRKRVADGGRDLREKQGVSKVLAVGRRKMISKPKDQEPVDRA